MKKIYLLGALAITAATGLAVGNNIEVQALTAEQDAALQAAAQEIQALPKYDIYAKVFDATDEAELKAAILGVDGSAPVDSATDLNALRSVARNLPRFYEYKYLYELVFFYNSGNEDPEELLEMMQKAVDVCNLLFGVTRAKSLAAQAAAVAQAIEAAPATTPANQPATKTAKVADNSLVAQSTVATAEASAPITAEQPAANITEGTDTADVQAAPADLATPEDNSPLGTVLAHTATGVAGVTTAGATLIANRRGYKGARRVRF